MRVTSQLLGEGHDWEAIAERLGIKAPGRADDAAEGFGVCARYTVIQVTSGSLRLNTQP